MKKGTKLQSPIAPAGSNFYYALMFLPPAQREALGTIYAFCREVDDIVDECSDHNVAANKLSWWHQELEKIYHGTPQHPVAKALVSIVQTYSLPKIWFEEILQGMTMDLQYQGYQTFDDLKLYCHCVASTVGMLAATVFGYKDPKTLEYAKKLGIAFQLINIIRDIGEDARRGRVYLSEEDLQQFQIDPQDILKLQVDPNKFARVLKSYAARARNFYNEALNTLPQCDRASQRSGLIMAKIYFSILDEIELSQFATLNQKITITPMRKLWITWRTWRQEAKLCTQSS